MVWDIAGAQVLITGGTSGIGRAAAAELARRGAEVMITARDDAKGQAAAAAIRADTGVDVQVGLLDLSRLDSVREFAADYTRRYDRLDVLVNNAGTMTGQRMQTPDGVEWTFGVNHLAPFLLTRLLTDLLVASAPSRVISVSSEVHRSAKQGLDLADLQMTRGWSAQQGLRRLQARHHPHDRRARPQAGRPGRDSTGSPPRGRGHQLRQRTRRPPAHARHDDGIRPTPEEAHRRRRPDRPAGHRAQRRHRPEPLLVRNRTDSSPAPPPKTNEPPPSSGTSAKSSQSSPDRRGLPISHTQSMHDGGGATRETTCGHLRHSAACGRTTTRRRFRPLWATGRGQSSCSQPMSGHRICRYATRRRSFALALVAGCLGSVPWMRSRG